MIEHLQAANQSAKAQFGKISERFANLDAVRQQLQSLRDLGDLVDQDDVIRSASHLVGKGLTPAGLAGLLADMPQEGQALASWVNNLWQFMTQREQQMMPLMQKARFNLGVSSLQLLAGHHVQQRVGELQQPVPNAMAQAPQSGDEGAPQDNSAGGEPPFEGEGDDQ